MTKKIVKFPKKKKKSPKKLIIEKLRSKYPRIKIDYQYTELKYSEKKRIYGKCDYEDRIFRISNTLKDEGYTELNYPESAGEVFPVLEHIFYRSLKLVYGKPDRLTMVLINLERTIEEIEDDDLLDLEWSYFLKLGEGYYFEFKKGDKFVFPKMKIWVNLKEKPFDMILNLHETFEEFIASKKDFRLQYIAEFIEELQPETMAVDAQYVEELKSTMESSFAEYNNLLSEFINLLISLAEIVSNDYSIDDVSDYPPTHYITNVYFEYLQSGNSILELAEEISTKKNETINGIHQFGQLGKIIKDLRNIGTLFISATVYYLMALEGFINLLYEFLLEPDFEHEQYGRFIRESSPELKILHLHLYCKGFSSSKITPEDDAIKYWKQIRGFRNNLVHANLSKVHEWMRTMEDNNFFFYNILFHRKFSKKIKNHSNPWLFRKENAIQVKSSVEGIVANIIEKMDEKEKGWIKSWIDNDLIKVPT